MPFFPRAWVGYNASSPLIVGDNFIAAESVKTVLHGLGRRPFIIAVMGFALVLSGCTLEAPSPARATQALPSTPPSEATVGTAPSRLPPTALWRPTSLPSKSPPPLQLPLRGWTVATGGAVFVLDAAGRVHRLSGDHLEPLSTSMPLYGGHDPGPSYLVADADRVFVSSPAVTRTLGLTREDYRQVLGLDRAGPLAIDPGRRLFLVGLVERVLWAYDLQGAGGAPQVLADSPPGSFRPSPMGVAADPAGRLLLVTLHDVSASPPHQREAYAAFDLDSLARGKAFESQLGLLSQPSFAPQAGRLVGVLAAKNGFLGSQVMVFDRNAQAIVSAGPLDGIPVFDAAGDWIYLLRERGLWVLQGSDLSLAAVEPFLGDPPSDLALSPDGQMLYLFRQGGLDVHPTSEVRAAGTGFVRGPLPHQWMSPGQPDFLRGRYYPAPGDVATAFVQVGGYGETYRTADGGHSWDFLSALTYPEFRHARYLSLSPDFALDRTLVVLAPGSMQAWRSTDAGDTWQSWVPPVALTSDRDGNREIYTADRPQFGLAASGLQRRTVDPSADENPAWSPAWTRLAFQSNRKGNWDIFTVRADCEPSGPSGESSCDLRQLTDDPGDDLLPAWSPDGRSIAFVSTRDGNPEIYVMDTDGGRQRRLTDHPGGDWRPAWLPDSRTLLFVSDRAGNNDIYRLAVPDEATAQPVLPVPLIVSPADERDPAVARDYLVFLSDREQFMRTYRAYPPYDRPGAIPVTPGGQNEAHPAPLDDAVGGTLVYLPEGDPAGIYIASSVGYVPFVVGAAFNGHPAGGPVPWLPDADWSYQRLLQFQGTGSVPSHSAPADPS
jgi:WD40-like Beta Propeller Repeat